MLTTKHYYLDCNIRIRNRQKQREAPIFSGRIWFDSLDQFIMTVAKKLQPFVPTVDHTRIWYRKQGGKYHSMHSSEQEFLDVCGSSNILISYFLHGPCPPPIIKSTTAAVQKIDTSSESIVSIALNLKDTLPTWSGSMQSWISLAKYYQEAGLKGTEIVGIPKNYRSLFTVAQEKSVSSIGINTSSIDGASTGASIPTVAGALSQPLDNDNMSLPKDKEKAVDPSDTTLPVSLPETRTANDMNPQTQRNDYTPSNLYINNNQGGIVCKQHFASQPINQVAPKEENNVINNAADLTVSKIPDQSDSLVYLSIPRVSAKAAYIITGVVYADIQEREANK